MSQSTRAATAVVVAAAMASLAATTVRAQSAGAPARAASAEERYTPPRTPWGEPDLQGTYSNRTITPMERAPNIGDREFFTPEEIATLERRAEQGGGDENRQRGTQGDVTRAYNDVWWDRGTRVTTTRTSLVIDPPNGRVPAQTEEARQRAAEERNRPVYRSAGAAAGRGTDTWLDRSTFERCITRGMPGAMTPTAYNNNYRFVQSPGVVAIQIEMLGGTRVIPTDGRPHPGPGVRLWHGTSVGRWEGDTLVVETKNFTDKVLFRGAAENLQLVERFTRVGPNEIDYRVTVIDPTTFTREWTMAVPFVDIGEQMYEYACHEGNYGLEGILLGAREEERRRAAAPAR